MKEQGSVTVYFAREMVICLSSKGWRRVSSAERENSGSSFNWKHLRHCALVDKPLIHIRKPIKDIAAQIVFKSFLVFRFLVTPFVIVSLSSVILVFGHIQLM